jgi:hypothetical protein
LSANPPSANQTAYSTPAPASPLSGAAEAPQRLPASLETAYSPEATARSGSGAAPSALQPGAENEQFAWFEKKLREYGASYYLLETWGSEGELYRFHCKMAVASNPNYTRHFEAMDRDKLQAMARVLEQVEAWRSGRLP